MLRAYDDLFWKADPDNHDLCGLRGLRQLGVAQVALQLGKRELALSYLKAARQSLPRFWEAVAMESFVKAVPQAELCRKAWTGFSLSAYVSRQLLNGELTPRKFLQKVVARMR
jgi:hypothetical protein